MYILKIKIYAHILNYYKRKEKILFIQIKKKKKNRNYSKLVILPSVIEK